MTFTLLIPLTSISDVAFGIGNKDTVFGIDNKDTVFGIDREKRTMFPADSKDQSDASAISKEQINGDVILVWQDDFDIFVAKSTDGGNTFGTPDNISNNPGNSVLPAIAIEGNNVYVVWNDNSFGNFDVFLAKSTDSGETFSTPENISNNEGSSAVAQIFANSNHVNVVWQDSTDAQGSREIFTARSTDGGETFSTPENISNNEGYSIVPQIDIHGNNVYIVWSDDTDGFNDIFMVKSTNGGETFSTPDNISDKIFNDRPSFAYQPSIDVNGNNIYVVWHEDPFGKRFVVLSKSTNGGETFSTPNIISRAFDFSSKSALAVEGDNVHVSMIVDIPDNNDVFVAKSKDGGKTFSKPTNISNNPGYSSEPNAPSTPFFETSIVTNGKNVFVAWTDGTTGSWEILLAKSTDGGNNFGTPMNISNNAGESREPDLAILP